MMGGKYRNAMGWFSLVTVQIKEERGPQLIYDAEYTRKLTLFLCEGGGRLPAGVFSIVKTLLNGLANVFEAF